MIKSKILLLSGNYWPEPTGIGKYNGEMITWLAKKGMDCTVITTYPYYPAWEIQKEYKSKSRWFSKETSLGEGKPIEIYRCPHYIPSRPSGFNRILSDLTFFLSAFLQIFGLLFSKKFDLIIVVVPAFHIGLLGILYSKIRGGKVIYHVQDLQIDAAKELGMIKSKLLLKLLFRIEKFILINAHYVSTISEGMVTKLMEKCTKRITLFPNWVDTDAFHPMREKVNLKQRYNFKEDEKIVLYSGAIGEKQGIESLLSVAQLLLNSKIKFVICGSGPYKDKLIAAVEELQLSNVVFLPLQPKENFNTFLNMADLHLVLQKSSAKDLVMPSKLSTILSVGGLALVTATRKTSLYNIVTKHDMAIIIEPENVLDLQKYIMIAMEHSFTAIKDNARKFALDYLHINKVIENFLSDIQVHRTIKTDIKSENKWFVQPEKEEVLISNLDDAFTK